MGKLSPLQAMLAAGLLDPMITRVVLIATLRGMPQVICDGVVTRHEVSPGNEPGQSTLTLTGDDLSVLMDVIQIQLPWPALPDFARVGVILAKYAMFGITPIVIPSPVVTIRMPTQGYDMQTQTDLLYIQELAGLSGYTFYLEPGPAPMQSIAYFGPDIRIPVPQPALSVNSDWAHERRVAQLQPRWPVETRHHRHDPRSDHAQDPASHSGAEHQHPEAAARRAA